MSQAQWMLLVVALPHVAFAQSAGRASSIVIDYVAPTECLSADAFDARVHAQAARPPNGIWHFAVRIRAAAFGYVGTLTTNGGTRELAAATCDEVAGALALSIATLIPDDAPTPPVTPVAAEALPVVVSQRHQSPIDWRIGARFQTFTNTGWLTLAGPELVASVEPRFGRYHMMFELGVGVLLVRNAPVPTTITPLNGAAGPPNLGGLGALEGLGLGTTLSTTLLMADLQICPLDLPFGRTGLSLLACTRAAGAINYYTHPSAYVDGPIGSSPFWLGGNARLRWQSPWLVYAEAQVGVVYNLTQGAVATGTQNSLPGNSPGLLDLGGTLGLRI